LPARQSFIYIFLILLVCYRAYMHLDVIPKRHISLAFFSACGFIILAEKMITEEFFRFYVYYAAILFLAVYTGILFLYRKGRCYHALAVLLALTTVSLEATINMKVTGLGTTSRSAYIEDDPAVEKFVDMISSNPEFFRLKKVPRKTKNDGA